MAVAIRKARPDAEITPRDVKGFSKVVQVLRTGDVDLQATVSEGGVKAEKATQEMLARLQSPAKREPADEEDKVS
ncbi:hypothetical protein SAMN05216272_10411 [Pseudomonas panipatensis]|uniref:Uncharacterized protein n=2 Tax=Pseudomonas panipatensis TaxID=428992 RepID=A0A1G8G4T5_9PSED|nr:hypothetical protein SAMN05216272_10411 [Pseudomonas panipatensis]SMP45340.1 hypothetical protein SAMN06295951_101973 [Pseudomonas panipatensis]